MSFFISVILPFVSLPRAFADQTPARDDSNLVLGSGNVATKSGNIFLSSKKKDELLVKTNIWGAVQLPGIHYIPAGTNLLNAISIAGGPATDADMDDVTLSTTEGEKTVTKKLSLKDALLNAPNSNPNLLPGDTVYVSKNTTRQTVSFWIEVSTFVITAVIAGLVISGKR